jgi:hypothetical protein
MVALACLARGVKTGHATCAMRNEGTLIEKEERRRRRRVRGADPWSV